MRKIGWALIGITALTAGSLQVAYAGATCKHVPSWCPAALVEKADDTKPTSVPEPASLMLLGAGVASVGAAALRRRRKK